MTGWVQCSRFGHYPNDWNEGIIGRIKERDVSQAFEFISMNRKRSWNIVTGDLFKGAFLDSYFKDELTRFFFGVGFWFCVYYLAYLDYLSILLI